MIFERERNAHKKFNVYVFNKYFFFLFFDSIHITSCSGNTKRNERKYLILFVFLYNIGLQLHSHIRRAEHMRVFTLENCNFGRCDLLFEVEKKSSTVTTALESPFFYLNGGRVRVQSPYRRIQSSNNYAVALRN